jgi:peptidoglycan lytic transglycosylase
MRLPRSLTVTLAALLTPGLLGAAAGSALADSGGATPDQITLPGATPIVVNVVGNPIAHAAGDRIAISVRTSATQQGGVHVTGTAPAGAPGSTVRIERLDPQAGWTLVATAPVAQDGSFSLLWHPKQAGPAQLRAVAGGGTGATDAAGAKATPQVGVTIYRRGVASWYAPVGETTACGIVVDKDTVGVAHRTLPCGTPVLLYYRGRTVVAPVIDRGPYVHGRTWDLTLPAFRALAGSSGAGLLTLGALAQPAPAAAPARHRRG